MSFSGYEKERTITRDYSKHGRMPIKHSAHVRYPSGQKPAEVQKAYAQNRKNQLLHAVCAHIYIYIYCGYNNIPPSQ
jgi:hypothetical protein